MNSERRKNLTRLINDLQEAVGKIEDIRDQLDTLKDEEQDAYDNLPESFQEGDRGQAMQSAIDFMQSAYDYADNATSEANEAISEMENARDAS